MAYGFNTTKSANAFSWTVTRTEWNEVAGRSETTVIRFGACATRAQALGSAKRWVLFFRKGGQV